MYDCLYLSKTKSDLFAVSKQNGIFIIDEKRIKLDSNTNQTTEGNNQIIIGTGCVLSFKCNTICIESSMYKTNKIIIFPEEFVKDFN